MDESRLLIVGANGQLGLALKAKYPKAKTTDINNLDISDKKSVDSYDWKSVDIILNAAAYTNVDEAETGEGRIIAWKVNTEGISNLVSVALENNLILIHISSEYVFDGSKSLHLESEPVSPLGVYGQTKAAADIIVKILPKHYLIRTSWVIGEGKNFVRTMLALGQKGVEPTVVNDQIGRLTFTSELVRAIDHLITNNLDYGIYNLSNSGEPSSWANITREIFKLANFKLSVKEISTAEYFIDKNGSAPRPMNSTLSLDKIQSTKFHSRDWLEDLKIYINKEKTT